MPIEPQALYARINHLIDTVPNLHETITNETLLWFGRAIQWVGAVEGLVQYDAPELRKIMKLVTLGAIEEPLFSRQIIAILFRALAKAEMSAPVEMQGAFIAAGNEFDAFAMVGKVLARASKYVRLIDRYLDENAFTEYALLVPENVRIEMLAGRGEKPAVKPASARFVSQYGIKRPLEVRVCTPQMLHDRVIDVDGAQAWIVTQSFNGLAKRSHASITRAPPEVSQVKLESYGEIWDKATPI